MIRTKANLSITSTEMIRTKANLSITSTEMIRTTFNCLISKNLRGLFYIKYKWDWTSINTVCYSTWDWHQIFRHNWQIMKSDTFCGFLIILCFCEEFYSGKTTNVFNLSFVGSKKNIQTNLHVCQQKKSKTKLWIFKNLHVSFLSTQIRTLVLL